MVEVVGAGDDTCGLVASYVVDGRTHTARTRSRSGVLCDRQVGEQVTVRYVAQRPQEATIGSTDRGLAVFLLAGGGLFVAVGTLWRFIGVRPR